MLEQASSATTGANVEMYANGDAVAAWKQLDPNGETTYAARYD